MPTAPRGRSQAFGSWGNTFGVGLVKGGPGNGAPGAGEFSKFFKKFLEKLLKCIILEYFSKNLANRALFFRAFGRKAQIVESFDENSIEKLNL